MTIDVSVHDLSVSVSQQNNEFLILDSIELEVQQEHIVTILGPSGCGKSTLLRVLAGLQKPTRGIVCIDPLRFKSGIGYVPQAPQLLPWRTLLQNACIGSEINQNGISDASIDRICAMIHQFRLSGFEYSFPHQLSGGMAQRVSLIRALQFNPSILLCDEPFSAVDFVSRYEFNILFRNMCSAMGITAIVVTHNIEEAIYLSDKIILLGGSPGSILKEYKSRPLPDRTNVVECRESNEFKEFFNEIWFDLKGAYRARE
jgi:NitT/TauT family transport system ATP-binding protein